MSNELVINALRMAWFKRRPDKQAGLILKTAVDGSFTLATP
jgi:hypothetical protein